MYNITKKLIKNISGNIMGNINFQLEDVVHQQLKRKCASDNVKIKDVIPALVKYYISNGIKAKNTIEILPRKHSDSGKISKIT